MPRIEMSDERLEALLIAEAQLDTLTRQAQTHFFLYLYNSRRRRERSASANTSADDKPDYNFTG